MIRLFITTCRCAILAAKSLIFIYMYQFLMHNKLATLNFKHTFIFMYNFKKIPCYYNEGSS